MEIVPSKGVGDIEFGLSANEVHCVLGEPTRRVGKTEQYSSGWMVDYDAAGHVKFLQTWLQPLVTLNGCPLVGATAADVVALVRALGVEPHEFDRDGRMYVHELGFGFMGDPVESVRIYPPGYYDAFEQER
jgi:hypothetical protein